MSEEHGDDLVFAGESVVVETEFGEVTVVSNHVRNRTWELGDDAAERRLVEGLLQVLHDREINIAFFKKGDRPTGVASTGVEIQSQVFVAHELQAS